MNQQKNIIVLFNEKGELVFSDMVKKYNLEESDEEDFKKLQEGKLSLEVMVKKTIRAFVGGIITLEDFQISLEKILQRDKQTINTISKDIIENLLPLLEKVPEDKLGEYNHKRNEAERKERARQQQKEDEYDKEVFKETLLNKIRGSVSLDEPEPEKEKPTAPNLKKPAIQNVEKNAEALKTQKTPIVTDQRNAKPLQQNPVPKVDQKPVDPYKEAIE